MMEKQIEDQVRLAEMKSNLDEARELMCNMYDDCLSLMGDNTGVIQIMKENYRRHMTRFQTLSELYGKTLQKIEDNNPISD